MQKILFLILSALVISGCGLPKFPVGQVRILDARAGVCSVFSIIQQSSGKPKYKRIGEIPLSECDGTIGFSPADYKKAEAWGANANDNYTCKLKE